MQGPSSRLSWSGNHQWTSSARWSSSESEGNRLAGIKDTIFNLYTHHSATIAQSYNEFWVGVPSQPVQIVRRDLSAAPPLPTQSPSASAATTRAPYVPPSYVAPNNVVAVSSDPIYNGCGQSKNCLGFPDGCVATKSCTSITVVTVRGDVFEFEIQSGKGESSVFLFSQVGLHLHRRF